MTLNSNNQWLRKQAISFLGSKKDDVTVFEMFPQIKDALNKRGFTNDDFSRMLRTINNERKQAKEAPQKEKQPAQGNETATVETKHREPVRPLNADIKRQTNASGGKVRSGKSQILKMLDERSKK